MREAPLSRWLPIFIPLTEYSTGAIFPMTWNIEYTDHFGVWWDELSMAEQDSVWVSVRLLEHYGPNLRHPHSSGINGSCRGHMRELRLQHAGRPYRVLYAFDPFRAAILLLGADKTGNDRWYKENIPRADALYDQHLALIKQEGINDGEEIL
jgi:hypothetical protein